MSLLTGARPRRLRICVLLACILLAVTLPRRSFAQSDMPPLSAAGRSYRSLLPMVQTARVTFITGATYTSTPVLPPPTNRPAAAHGDLNLALRGYSPTTASQLELMWYDGDTHGDAPQMPAIFADRRTPVLTAAYRVNDWNWECSKDGCRGDPLVKFDVTLLGLATQPGERISFPSRGEPVYGADIIVLVLYAEEHRITLKYTREDSVATGYTVHLEDLNVDTNLLDLYRRNDAAGRGQLPGLKNGQPLGLASGSSILVAIRDSGTFMDPRSRKDWWQGR